MRQCILIRAADDVSTIRVSRWDKERLERNRPGCGVALTKLMQARTLALQSIDPSDYADSTDLIARNPLMLRCCAESREVNYESTFTDIFARDRTRLCVCHQ